MLHHGQAIPIVYECVPPKNVRSGIEVKSNEAAAGAIVS